MMQEFMIGCSSCQGSGVIRTVGIHGLETTPCPKCSPLAALNPVSNRTESSSIEALKNENKHLREEIARYQKLFDDNHC